MSSKTQLTVRQHYHGLLDLLKRYAHLWWSIGLELKFYPNELKVIQSNPMFLTHPNPTVGYLGEMLELWLLRAPGDRRGSRSFATFEELHATLLRVDGIAVEVLDGLHMVLDQPQEKPLTPVVHSTPQSPLEAATLPQPNADGPVPHQHIQSSLIATVEQPMEDSSRNEWDINVDISNDEQPDLNLTSSAPPMVSSDEKSDLNLESTAFPSNDRPCDIDNVQSVPNEQSHEASLQDKLDKLEHEYRMITFNFDQSLECVALKKLQSYVASLPLRVRTCYKELKTNDLPSKVKHATCVSEFVAAINDYSNFMNPALLGDAVKMFGDEKTKSEITAYNSKLQEFQVSTKLEDFVKVTWEGVTPKGYEQIELELEENWHKKTLKDISPPKRSWLFKKVFEGSLKVIFSIPDLTDLKEEDVLEFLQKHVKRVSTIGQCILNFETEVSHDLQLSPISSQSVSEETFTLPDAIALRFSSFSHGKNVIVSEDGLEARRRDVRDRGGGGVYIPTPLSGRVEFEIEVTDCNSRISYSLAIGIAQTPRGSYKHLDISLYIRDYYCYWGGKQITSNLSGLRVRSSFGSVNLHDVERGDRVGLQVTSEGDLSFTFNGITQGVAARNIYREDYDTYLYVNVDGSTTAVRITRAAMSGYQPPAEGHKGQVDQLATPPEGSVSPNPIDFKFHPVTGKNIVLLEDGLVARRINPSINLYDAVVYGSVPIKHRGTLEVEIVEFGTAWPDSIMIGVMKIPSGTELKESDVPEVLTRLSGDNHCVWRDDEVWNRLDGDLTKSKYGSVNLRHLRQGDKVGMRLSSDGTLSFFVNGRVQGVAVRGLNEDGYDIYPVVDVRCNCCAVKITRAETHSELVLDLQDLCIEKIASCLDWSSKDVNLLPLPQGLKNQTEHHIDYL